MTEGNKSAGSKASMRAGIALAIFLGLAALIWFFDVGNLYLWLKAFHLIAVISWIAGMVYLPRLFVYHSEAEIGSTQSETFKLMERRLLKIIATPAMILSWVFGLALAFYTNAFFEPWFVLKFLAVLGMSAFHGFLAKSVKAFANDNNAVKANKWRLYNEVPTVLMIVIIILVVIKPF